jgi:hypothetical protein
MMKAVEQDVVTNILNETRTAGDGKVEQPDYNDTAM